LTRNRSGKASTKQALKRDGRLGSDLGGSPEEVGRRRWWSSDVDGDGAPAISHLGEVEDEVQLFAAVTKISSGPSPSSPFDGDVRMELSNSGGTPTSNYRRTGDL
jgi:hypothetical protein